MANNSVKLAVPFQSLLEAVKDLSLKDKLKLRKLLSAQTEQAEEDEWDRDPQNQAKIQKALAAYEAGEYITRQEYLAQRNKNEL